MAIVTHGHIAVRGSYSQYFVGSGSDYDDVRESDRLQRLAAILGVSGYWVYMAVVITAAIGMGIGSRFSSKCLPATWFLTALVSVLYSFTSTVSRNKFSGAKGSGAANQSNRRIPSGTW